MKKGICMLGMWASRDYNILENLRKPFVTTKNNVECAIKYLKCDGKCGKCMFFKNFRTVRAYAKREPWLTGGWYRIALEKYKEHYF